MARYADDLNFRAESGHYSSSKNPRLALRTALVYMNILRQRADAARSWEIPAYTGPTYADRVGALKNYSAKLRSAAIAAEVAHRAILRAKELGVSDAEIQHELAEQDFGDY